MHNKMIKENKLKKIYTLLIAIYPIFSYYGTFINQISISDLLAIFFVLISIFYFMNNPIKINKSIHLLLYSLISLFVVISFVSLNDIEDTFWSGMRYSFELLLLVIYSYLFFDLKIGKKTIIRIAYFSSIYLIFQYLLSLLFNIYLPAGIPFLKSNNESMIEFVNELEKYGGLYRPRSLFSEPAHYCQYVILALVIILFDNWKTQIKEIITICIGIIISASTLGIISTLFVFIIFILDKMRKKRYFVQPIYLIITVLIVILSIFIFIRSPQYNYVLDNKINTSGGLMSDSRVVNNLWIFNQNYSSIELLFGHGLGQINVYLSSFPKWYWTFGIIGIVELIFFIVYNFNKGNRISKIICIIFLFECFGSELLLGYYFMIYFSFILANCNDDK